MKLVELVIDDSQDLYGIDAISLVEHPAIEADFVALSKQKELFATQDSEKRIVMGPALIPDRPIYRKDDWTEEEFHVYFSKKTVRRCMELFMTQRRNHDMTIEHKEDLNGLSVVESWIVESKECDKSKLYGLDAPVGTWMTSIKVDNEVIWNDWVKEGKVKGFSIEGYFVDKFEHTPSHQKEESLMRDLQALLSAVHPATNPTTPPKP